MNPGRCFAPSCEKRGRTNRLALALAILVLPSAPVLALNPKLSLSQYVCRTWNAQNGFPSSAAKTIIQTKDGFIWIGTQKGIVRFDGLEFKQLTLPQTQFFQYQAISSLCASEDGGLWFGIQNGAFGKYQEDSRFAIPTNQAWATPEMKVASLLQARDGSLWIGAGTGVTHWWPRTNTVQLFNFDRAECLAMFEDTQGRIWFSMLGRGLFIYNGTRMIPFPDPALTNNNTIVYGIAEDRKGQFWFATQSGVRVYDADLHPQPGPPMDDQKITCILIDREGTVWMGSDGEGLFCWRHGRLTNFKKSDGLVDDHVTALLEDNEGNLWVGTRSGLNLFSDVKFPLYEPEGDQQNVAFHSVCTAAGGGIWAGSGMGLFRLDQGKFTYYGPTNAGLSSYWLKQVFEARDGDVYLANANQQVEIFRDGKVVARHKCPTWQTGFAEDHQGVVVGVGGRLFRVSRSSLTPYVFTHGAPTFGWIRSLNSTRDGTILVASVNGLFLVKDGGDKQFSVENGLPGNEVLWACEDHDGVIWAGLSDGVARIAGDRVDSWTRANGLYDNYVRSIIPDDNGWLWIDSDSGIFRVRRDSFIVDGHKAERLKCEAFSSMDAVKTFDTADVELSACKTRDGRIWIPSPQGIILIDPAHLPTNALPPLVHIEGIRVNGKEWSGANGLTVAPGKGELEVQYTAPTFIDPQEQQFRYKLEGYESKWQNAGTRRSAFYTNLKPGKYRFLVEACGANDSAAGEPASFAIELLPFYYQTAGFRVLCGGLVLAVLAGIYAWRINFLKRKHLAIQASHDRLELEVQNRTAELQERTLSLEKEIAERKQMQLEIERVHRKLLEASRVAGMAEVATGVLHNVGNVLNSVNVSTNLLIERTKASRITAVARISELLKEHEADLGDFISRDPKGRQIPIYLTALSEELGREQKDALDELTQLHGNVNHIKEIVSTQQNYARTVGVTTVEDVAELVEDALRINEAALERHNVSVLRHFDDGLPRIIADRHKVMQILLNLIRNAKYACEESQRNDKQLMVRITRNGHGIMISVTDNGVGIPSENLKRIFNHGFTTRKNGHGFGLHSGALAAKEMGGELRAESDGPGAGATFFLELPLKPPAGQQNNGYEPDASVVRSSS